jgi:hypothetical protein
MKRRVCRTNGYPATAGIGQGPSIELGL